ncbi:SDR family oxidoreductase [Saccharibacillus endophyticus]|uniref:NmrA-like domain-containing protein n=1 Tax=Saccharibacillus endophyticus TaxID=2060666 RepID=A0ABQ1ZQV2_9BACL|nr:NmrA family NAD(P)-binding protein [Saccharibacillus endophyticus]GGH75874.1 hypothetical protein GCM10007362_17340 [Saccharibacillus endophyticus]
MERVLVYGASGVQGGAVARLLIEQGFGVRTVTRSEQKAEALRQQGIEAFVGNMDNPDALVEAHVGVDKVFLNLPIEFDLSNLSTYAANTVEAAKRAGVKLIVVNSNGFLPEEPSGFESLDIKLQMIEQVKASGIPWIVVKPTLYLENLLIPGVVGQEALAYPIPADKPIAWISSEDAAQYHAYALSHAELAGRTLHASGGEALTGIELAARFSEALGRKITFLSLPYEHFEAGLSAVMGVETAAGVTGFYRWIGSEIDSLVLKNEDDRATRSLLKLTPVADWIRKPDILPAFNG